MTHQVGVSDAHVRQGVDDVVLDGWVLVVGRQKSTEGRNDLLGHLLILKAHLGKRDDGESLQPENGAVSFYQLAI